MKKLKIWQIVLLVLFFPVGTVYFAYWLYQTQISPDPQRTPLEMRQIVLYAVFFPIGIIAFFRWFSKYNQDTADPTDRSTAPMLIKGYAIAAAVIVTVAYLMFLGGLFGAALGDSSDNDDPVQTTTKQPLPNYFTDADSTTKPSITTTASTTPNANPETTTAPITTKNPVTTTAPITTKDPVTTSKPTTQKPSEDNPPILLDDPETNTSKIELISITSPIARNEMASLTIKGKPNTQYKMAVKYMSGWSTAGGLGYKMSDADGYVTWTWKVGGRTTPGEHPIKITCDDGVLETSFITTE